MQAVNVKHLLIPSFGTHWYEHKYDWYTETKELHMTTDLKIFCGSVGIAHKQQ